MKLWMLKANLIGDKLYVNFLLITFLIIIIFIHS